jgi:hypothetical protein
MDKPEFSDIVVRYAPDVVHLEFGYEGDLRSPLRVTVSKKAFEKMLVREAQKRQR